ncbi:hypothetical protein BN1051_01816 [Arthrobacter saudimassiliensis]|uniref:DUF3515 domain-containing protein n=1 Tax=Arthrobacter saudimassiliensis TaxID=1461584 RepID=A0A078MME4_9MICC|nr:hypothetical protein BN1051_01816 [Arthrobacter saudimassiliensis]
MKRLPTAAGVLAAAALLSACTPVADVEAAPDAENPACAEVMVYLPVELAETPLRDTNSQATAAWGNPSKVILRCGVPVPGPTTDPCASVNGVDWLLREEGDVWRATTYGREPAVEVVFNPNEVASSTLLVELAGPVSRIEPTGECLSPQDTLEIP